MERVTIYHNPKCGTSRNTLTLIREAGIEPNIVEYMKDGWDMETLQDILHKMNGRPIDILRKKEPVCAELGLDAASTPDALLKAMVEHPVLVERPIVVAGNKAKLCRPAELVLGLIHKPMPASYAPDAKACKL